MARELHIDLHQITGGACRNLPGRCPHTVCRFNLTSERRDNRGAKSAKTRLPIVREACALEAAELGGMTLEEIATRLSLTRERVRQIELGALTKLWLRLGGNNAKATVSAVGMRRCSRIAA
ncbi:MAG TPA: sigma factor-like helix-turn-helix DNA-binding protein [Polyangia bacterium]